MKKEMKHNLGAFRVALLLAFAAVIQIGMSRAVRAQTATPTPTPAWTQSGTSIINTNTGNVGVGTASPSFKLEIQGATSRNTMALIGDGDTVGYAGLKVGALTTTGIATNKTSAFNLVMRKDNCFGGDGSGPSFVIETVTKSGGFAGPFMIAPNNDVILNSGTCVSGMSVGRVGIGTAAPGANLDVKGANLAVRATMTGTTGANGKFQIFWSDPGINSNPFGEMQLYAPTGAGSEYLRFNIANSNGATYTDALTISRTGFVGVGTATPGSLFEVKKDQATGTEIRVNNANTSGFAGLYLNSGFTQTSGGFLQWNNTNSANNLFLSTGGAAPLYLGTNNAPRMTILPTSGYVGVGTTTPAYKLDVQGGQVNVSGGLCIAGVCKSSWSEVGGSSQWAKVTSGISYNSGSVGIGTESPSQQLHVMNASTAVARVESSGAAAAAMQFKNLSRHWVIGAGLLTGGSDFSVYDANAGATRMYVDASGNVGIGTTSPTAKLDVQGDINVSGYINAKYQDVAEWVPSRQKLSAGTVVVLDTDLANHVLASSKPYDTRVAGVVSAQPGIALGERGEDKALVATTGRVKVKVDATRSPIKIGDLLVTGEASGVAMKSEPITVGGRSLHAPGTIIGKALEPLEKGVGEILVLLSLQ